MDLGPKQCNFGVSAPYNTFQLIARSSHFFTKSTPPKLKFLRSYITVFFINHMYQAAGACWYLLGIQRATKCLKEQCTAANTCGLRMLSCEEPIYYGTTSMVRDGARLAWAENKAARSRCLESSENYEYGAYKWTVQIVTNDSRLEKILFPIFWGLMTLRYCLFFFRLLFLFRSIIQQ